jgi:hypothetical protein
MSPSSISTIANQSLAKASHLVFQPVGHMKQWILPKFMSRWWIYVMLLMLLVLLLPGVVDLKAWHMPAVAGNRRGPTVLIVECLSIGLIMWVCKVMKVTTGHSNDSWCAAPTLQYLRCHGAFPLPPTPPTFQPHHTCTMRVSRGCATRPTRC